MGILVRATWLVGLVLAIGGCGSNQDKLQTKESANLAPAPVGKPTQLDLAKRYRGQTEFLQTQIARGRMGDPPSAAEKAAPAGGGRAEQEADIFKIGKSGSKLLFLLNSYRGLQVVSYAEGPNSPRLLGRVKPTGNYPRDMYYDSKNDRLIVLENLWQSDVAAEGRLVIYDVKTPAAPKIVETVKFKGNYADSRMVGDVLYLATSVPPRSGDWNNTSEKSKGYVMSFGLSAGAVRLVEEKQLELPSVYGELMNMVQVGSGPSAKYYLLSVQSESSWIWWDRQSQVQVIDISDPQGHIRPVMVVSVKGRVKERSHTSIQDGQLVVVSNYSIGADQQRRLRVAVEAFQLPTDQAEVISETEAEYRRLHIDRELSKVTEGEREARRQQLLKDKELGLGGRYVRSTTGSLKKLVADSAVTVGDDEGQSADVQDVRYADGLLYVFWVPANQVDPFDLFDVSQLQTQGVQYLGRLKFNGWVAKAIPVTYSGRRFVVGLGWVVPPVNNEQNRRKPQAKIFEIRQNGRQIESVEVRGAELHLSRENLWANFNLGDKFFEPRIGSDGTGVIMFPADLFSSTGYAQGGQLVHVDLNKVLAGQPKEALREGAFLAAPVGWLQRIFSNPEVDRVNTFSNEALGTFDPKQASASGLTQAVHILELARNLVSYLELGGYGVQVIHQQDWFRSDEAKTQLRVTTKTQPDAEKDQVRSLLELPGAYQAHAVLEGQLWVHTRESKYLQDGQNSKSVETDRVFISQLLENGELKLIAQADLVSERHWGRENSNTESVYDSEVKLLSLGKEGVLLNLSNGAAVARRQDQAISLSRMALAKCGETENRMQRVREISQQLYLLATEALPKATDGDLVFVKNYLAPLTVKGQTGTCGPQVNIPGEPVMITDKGEMLTSDTWLVDVVTQVAGDRKYSVPRTAHGLTAVKMNAQGSATLVDQLEDSQYGEVRRLGSEALLRLKSKDETSSWGRPSRRQFAQTELEVIRLEAGFITVETFLLPEIVVSYPRLLGVNARDNRWTIGVQGGQSLRFYRWQPGQRPEALTFRVSGQKESVEALELPGYVYGGSLGFSDDGKRVTYAMGLYGAEQVVLAK